MASSGFHSNGYSLVRRVVSAAGLDLAATPAGLDRPLGDELLEPTRIYAKATAWRWSRRSGSDAVHAFAHITGGGLAGNTARVVPAGLEAVLDRSTWALPAAVRLMEEHGVPRDGVRAGVQLRRRHGRRRRPDAADAAVAQLTAAGFPAWVAGELRSTDGDGATARLENSYR